MKQLIFAAIAVLFFYSCGVTKNQNMNQSSKKETTTIIGTVVSEKGEMDGSIFKVKTKDNITYEALISIPNLGRNEYKNIQIGNKVALKGEAWKMEKENNLTVRKIIALNTDNFKVSGKVKSIQHGDDGSVYNIKTDDDEMYTVGITFIGMGSNSDKIKEYKVGDTLEAVGKLWKMGNKLHVTANNIPKDLMFLVGEIKGMGKGTDGIDGFMLQLKAPNDKEYDALIDGLSLMKKFKVGNKVALNGVLKFDKYFYVKEIVSTNADAFVTEGVVEHIKNGRDGYVATIKAINGETYKALISIPNLGKDKEYKAFNIGETIKVKGELWKLGEEKQITVREIL